MAGFSDGPPALNRSRCFVYWTPNKHRKELDELLAQPEWDAPRIIPYLDALSASWFSLGDLSSVIPALFAHHDRMEPTEAVDERGRVWKRIAAFLGGSPVELLAGETVDELWVRQRAESAAANVLKRMRPIDVAQLEDQTPPNLWPERFVRDPLFGLDGRSMETVPGPGCSRFAVLALLSMCPNGFVREHALRLIAEETHPLQLSFVLLRANDSLPQVRAAAVDVTERILREQGVVRLVENAPLLSLLLHRGRVDHSAFVASLDVRILRDSSGATLLNGLLVADFEMPMALARVAERAPPDLYADAVELAARRGAYGLFEWAARQLGRLEIVAPDRVACVRRLLNSRGRFKTPRLAFYSALQCDPADALDVLPTHLLNPTRELRRSAQNYLQQMTWGSGDPWTNDRMREVYLGSLSAESPKLRSIALSGLGEVGSAADAPRIRSLMEEDTERVRATALRVLSKLDPSCDRDELVRMLADPHLRVAKQASRLLGHRLRTTDLGPIVSMSTIPHNGERAGFLVRLMDRLPTWERLIAILETAANPGSEAMRRATLSRLDRWKPTEQLEAPTPTVHERASAAFFAVRETLPEPVAQRLAGAELPFDRGPVFRG